MENPFEIFNKRLEAIEDRQTEILRLLQKDTKPAIADELPVTAKTAAAMFQIGITTLYHNKERIKHVKRFGRLYFYPADLKSYLDAGKNL